MSDDLVERLRGINWSRSSYDLRREAAAEIERLRAELSQERETCARQDMAISMMEADAEAAEAALKTPPSAIGASEAGMSDDLVNRLRRSSDIMADEFEPEFSALLDEAADEIELTAEVKFWHDRFEGADIRAGMAEAALKTARATKSRFQIGDRVSKTKGSSWRGSVVGHYSTSLTNDGVCVESEHEPGSVQIYPAAALARMGREK